MLGSPFQILTFMSSDLTGQLFGGLAKKIKTIKKTCLFKMRKTNEKVINLRFN